MAPIPVRTSGVSCARSKLVMQVAEPRTISPVRVSVMRMDQVADAGAARRAVARAAARRADCLCVRSMLISRILENGFKT